MCIRTSRSVACILLITASASADFVGVTTVNKDDPETVFLCNEANGAFNFGFGPLTVCNVFAVFDNPDNALLSVGNADLQVYDGVSPSVFFQHPLNFVVTSPSCTFVGFFPDLICDTFITIGYKCGPEPAGTDQSKPGAEFDAGEFNLYGHIVGGWFNANPANGQGEAGTWPDLKVLFLQSAMHLGHIMSGDIDLFWRDEYNGVTYAELDVPIECAVWKPDGVPCDDGDPCTGNPGPGGDVWMDGVCGGLPTDCDDANPCTDDACDPLGGCVNTPNDLNSCDDSDVCNGNEMCVGGTCQAGIPLGCDDANNCTDDDCDPVAGCFSTPVNCDDSDACTTDSCDPLTGLCVHDPIDCDDGNVCNGEESCDPDEGECLPGDPLNCDDGDACTIDHCDPVAGCIGPWEPLDCDDGDACTEDGCDPDTGCTHEDIECPKGQVCDPASGGCVEDQAPCECVKGRVTLCHIPPGSLDNARSITVGCAARDKHMAHGDTCGPCE
ncbi:MAG: hypothetical protein O7D91_16350 [Planctomycetota bacterium]|nr:hypothetical protein [Planctomycetota bacterium]